MTLCTEAVQALNATSAAEYVRQGPVEAPKSAVLAGLLAHDAEMYGISTVYLRAKNLGTAGKPLAVTRLFCRTPPERHEIGYVCSVSNHIHSRSP